MAFGRIGVILGDQPFDHRDHLGDVARRAWLMVGGRDAQSRHVLVVPADGFLGAFVDQLFERALGACVLAGQSGGVDLVVHVREVAHVGDIVRAIGVPQKARQHIEHDRGARVAQMCAVIDRGPADIHPRVMRRRRQRLFPLGRGVPKLDLGHRLLLSLSMRTGPRGAGYGCKS